MSVLDLQRFVEAVDTVRVDGRVAVEEKLREAVERPGAVLAAVGEPEKAGIRTIFRSDKLTILNIVWAPHMVLQPHDHNMWAVIGLYTGREDNLIWRRTGEHVEASGGVSLSSGDVFGMDADGVHSVLNPISRLTGALHIYGGDFFAPGRHQWDPETLQQEPFDVDALRRSFAAAEKRFAAA
jgi:predicted metal-dependent enzyme (double-stranded beta helix superfamily)